MWKYLILYSSLNRGSVRFAFAAISAQHQPHLTLVCLSAPPSPLCVSISLSVCPSVRLSACLFVLLLSPHSQWEMFVFASVWAICLRTFHTNTCTIFLTTFFIDGKYLQMREDWNTCKLHNIKWDSSQTRRVRERERERERNPPHV